MTRSSGKSPLWPAPGQAAERQIDGLFEAELKPRPGIRDRHGCVKWLGAVALFLALPSVGVTSYDLLLHTDRAEFTRIHREALKELAKRRASGLFHRRLEWPPEELRAAERRWEVIVKHGRTLPLVSGAFRRVTGTELGCIGLALPDWHDGSERQILRSLGLSIDEARSLMEGRKPALAPFAL